MFERDIPGENKAGLSGQDISRLPLETCQTMNGMWGYKIKDQNYKPTRELVRLLVRTAAKGANLLLNIGPMPDGSLPETALERLQDMGQFLNSPAGESIYATTAGDIALGDSVVSTKSRKDGTLYVHLLTEQPMKQLTLPLRAKVRTATALSTGETLQTNETRKRGQRRFSSPIIPPARLTLYSKSKRNEQIVRMALAVDSLLLRNLQRMEPTGLYAFLSITHPHAVSYTHLRAHET